MSTGFDLGLSSGIQTLNLDTKITGGTASVLDANSLNAASIAAGDNIKTLNVTALNSGTRDTVTIDANAASAVTLTGSGSPDLFTVTIAKNATLDADTMVSAGDVLTINAAGDFTFDANVAADNEELDVTINATSEATEVTLSDATHANAEKITLTGDQDITLKVTDGVALAQADYTTGFVVDSSTGTSTIEASALDNDLDFSNAVVDQFDIAGAMSADGAITINSATRLVLSENVAANLEIILDNELENTAFTTGTALLTVAESQDNDINSGDVVETLLVTSSADEAVDTDLDENGFEETSLTLASLTMDNDTTATVINGEDNLVITKLNVEVADQVVSASNMTGNLTISDIDGAFDGTTILGGSGNDSITAGLNQVLDIQTNAGNDTVDVTTTADAADGTEISTGAGDDTVYTGANSETVDLGAGNDTITVEGKETITLGDGADTVSIVDQVDAVKIKDFVVGTDVLKLTGTMTHTSFDFSSVRTPTQGVYILGDNDDDAMDDGEWRVELENGGVDLTTTDLSNSIQFSATVADASTVVAGSLDDTFTVAADETSTITTGDGSDTVILTANNAAATETGVTIKDFTVGTDKIVLTGALVEGLEFNLKNITAVDGVYSIGGDNDFDITIEDGTGSDIITEGDLTSIVQLGKSGANFIVGDNDDDAATSVTISGSTFDDYVQLIDGQGDNDQSTYNFSNDGGVDHITMVDNDADTQVNFDNLTGIDSAQGKVAFTVATDSKINDATNKAVYVFDGSKNTNTSTEITTFELDTANGYTQDVIDAEVAAFIDGNLGVSDGENYVVVINDTTTNVYAAKAYGNATDKYDAYIYLVNGDADGVDADDITLIGTLVEEDGTVGGTFTTLDIA